MRRGNIIFEIEADFASFHKFTRASSVSQNSILPHSQKTEDFEVDRIYSVLDCDREGRNRQQHKLVEIDIPLYNVCQ